MTSTYADDYSGRLCERYEPSLLALARVDAASHIALSDRLAEFARNVAVYGRKDLAEIVADHADPLRLQSLDIADMMVDIVVTSRASRTPLSRLVQETTRALKHVHTDVDDAALTSALLPLLETPAVQSLAVDEDLFAENSAVYIDARILRDFRPAYQEDVAGDPVGIQRYVSQQKLRIRYWSESRERVFEVTMRDDDLADLERWIFRARTKLPIVPDPVLREETLGEDG